MKTFLAQLHWPFQRRLVSAGKRRALLRLIATALEHGLDLAETVYAWSEESRGRWRFQLRRLARDLSRGIPLPDALERQPNLFSDEQALLVRFAYESGAPAPILRRRLDEPTPTPSAAWREPSWYLALFALIGLPIGAFVAFKINPELAKIFDEFGLETPVWLHSSQLGGLMLFGWVFSLIVLLISRLLRILDTPGVWFRRRVLGRLLPAVRSRRVAGVLQRLADTSKAGRPVTGALATLARRHYDPAIRHRLLEARNEVGLGVELWPALAEAGLLSPSERAALTIADKFDARAWTLQALAATRVQRVEARRRTANAIASTLAVGLFGLFVLATAMSLFSILTKLTNSLT